MIRAEDLKYDERGLVPCVVQDAGTGEVLTLAWQSREALERTLRSGQATFWSRSRGEIWVKGATSGNTQSVRAARTDCDHDVVLLRVEPRGPACHTGARSCFFEAVAGAPDGPRRRGGPASRESAAIWFRARGRPAPAARKTTTPGLEPRPGFGEARRR